MTREVRKSPDDHVGDGSNRLAHNARGSLLSLSTPLTGMLPGFLNRFHFFATRHSNSVELMYDGRNCIMNVDGSPYPVSASETGPELFKSHVSLRPRGVRWVSVSSVPCVPIVLN